MKTTKLVTAFLAALLIGLMLMECGCSNAWKVGKCTQWGVCKTIKDSVNIRDSVYYYPMSYDVASDSGFVQAFFECSDSLQVVARYYEIVNGKYIQMTKELKDGKYTVWAYRPPVHDTIMVKGKDRTVYRDKVQNIETNKLTKWQNFLIICGWIGIGLLVLILLYVVYRIYKKLKP